MTLTPEEQAKVDQVTHAINGEFYVGQRVHWTHKGNVDYGTVLKVLADRLRARWDSDDSVMTASKSNCKPL